MKLFVLFLTVSVYAVKVKSDAEFVTSPPFQAQKFARVEGPRGLVVDAEGDILVLSSTQSSVVALVETENDDLTVTVKPITILNGRSLGLTHGIALDGGFLYASSATTVYRWPYAAGQRSLINDPPTIIILGMPSEGHRTRTLIFDPANHNLYVSIGSDNDLIDVTMTRSMVKIFDITSVPQGGFQFNSSGEVFVNGLRNTVGLAFDSHGSLWGVDCGVDSLSRKDLGPDIRNDNPADELNQLSQGHHYGHPYCFSSDILRNYTTGTQFALPEYMNDGIHNDNWCRTAIHNEPPALALRAHNAPLGITFYNNSQCSNVTLGAFPCDALGDAIVAFHGSTNRDIPDGYRVAWLPFRHDNFSQTPTGLNINIIYEPNVRRCGSNCFRPVNAVFDNKGRLIVSTDSSNEIFRVFYNRQPPEIRANGSNGIQGNTIALFLFISTAIYFYKSYINV